VAHETAVSATGPRLTYEDSLLDWLACVIGGMPSAVTSSTRELGADVSGRIITLGAAGHALDFDDTYLPGLVHLSAPVAPVAVVVGDEVGATVGDAIAAYAAGFETMAALARASHPELYERGWHPTAVCGTVGAAAAGAHLYGLDYRRRAVALAIACLSAGGLRGAFGSHGKALQVGLAAAAGARAARLAASGASVDIERVGAGFEQAYGATWAEPDDTASRRAIDENWIKAYPCCLQTHSTIEAADVCRRQGAGVGSGGTITVHPVSRQAAPYDAVADGLQAKFSLPYTAAFAIVNGAPGVNDFRDVDGKSSDVAARLRVVTDPELAESESIFESNDGFEARVMWPLGSPGRPMDAQELDSKVRSLAGDRLDGVLAARGAPAGSLIERTLS
jgi:2-methylcitrate dehydratase PrpD